MCCSNATQIKLLLQKPQKTLETIDKTEVDVIITIVKGQVWLLALYYVYILKRN
jgi:hypothetical protein